MVLLPDGEKILKISSFVSTESTNVTERQTDRHTDTAYDGIGRAWIASRGKNYSTVTAQRGYSSDRDYTLNIKTKVMMCLDQKRYSVKEMYIILKQNISSSVSLNDDSTKVDGKKQNKNVNEKILFSSLKIPM